MFSNTEVIVTQSVKTQYIVASLSLSVISQSLPKHTNLPKFIIKFQKQKLRWFLCLLIIMTPMLQH